MAYDPCDDATRPDPCNPTGENIHLCKHLDGVNYRCDCAPGYENGPTGKTCRGTTGLLVESQTLFNE